eukprot:NODE_112_length_19362_cov_0.399678.p12 type:complete len:103 gc:universal NODE_112_length_19362_cov_0.399678:10115-10423(+)
MLTKGSTSCMSTDMMLLYCLLINGKLIARISHIFKLPSSLPVSTCLPYFCNFVSISLAECDLLLKTNESLVLQRTSNSLTIPSPNPHNNKLPSLSILKLLTS